MHNASVKTTPKNYRRGKEGGGATYEPEEFETLEPSLNTGDIAVLQRADQETPHYGIFVRAGAIDPHFPLLLVKTQTKPLLDETFDKSKRNLHFVTAQNRIFYGDYRSVSVLKLAKRVASSVTTQKVVGLVEQIRGTPYSPAEVKAIMDGSSPQEKSAIACTLTLALVFKELGLLETGVDMTSLKPHDLKLRLPVEDGKKDGRYVRVPKPPTGPMVSGEAPLLSRWMAIKAPLGVSVVPYQSLAGHIKTGDIVLFSGVSATGSIIKFFTHSNYSHVAIALCPKFTSEVFVLEATPNKQGTVDLASGKAVSGVQLVPLEVKVFSGWYNHVAVRHLKGIDSEAREDIYSKLFEFRKQMQGRPYEKNYLEFIRSAINFSEEYLAFLNTKHEDLSSLFCSELVAAAYQFVGLLSKERPSNRYTPDDFSSSKHLELQKGSLEGEVFISMQRGQT